jgi:cyanophycinase
MKGHQMPQNRIALSIAALLIVSGYVPAPKPAGNLLIAGGAIAPDNKAVAQTLASTGPADAPMIAIIASASAEPQGSFDDFRAYLIRHGVDAGRIVQIRLSLMDDPETPAVDESTWAANARDSGEIAKLEKAGAIWFTGGDQSRTARLMLASGGSDTPMLAAIRQRLSAGALVGGSSAGAAIMGSNMIVCGDADGAPSLPVIGDMAICEAVAEGEPTPLVIAPGLGFLPWAITDQHFSQRGREGRLERAVALQPKGAKIGLGVDENSAVLVNLRTRDIRPVAGRASIYDGRKRRLRVSIVQVRDSASGGPR